MIMTIDEEINRFERLASDYEFNLEMHQHNVMKLSVNDIERMKRYAQENRQLAEWLRELKKYEEGIVQIKELINDYKGHDMWDTANGMQLALECLEGSESE